MELLAFFALFLLLDIFLFIIVVYFRTKRGLSAEDLRFFQKKWQVIQREPDPRHALLDSDKLLHIALKKKGYYGSLGEQLKKARSLFSHLDDVWFAHKLRNRIAHEFDFDLRPAEFKRALSYYQQALKELKVL